MLDLGGLHVRSSLRDESDPLVIAGGGMANCCEPIAEFIDLFVLGEGEEAIVDLVQLVKTEKQGGASKEQILLKAAKEFDWAYVPALYKFEYDGDRIKSFQRTQPDLPAQFKSAVVEDFENAPVPLRPIVPFAQAVHERVTHRRDYARLSRPMPILPSELFSQTNSLPKRRKDCRDRRDLLPRDGFRYR
jgi:radical SAM superfamily enzyme YgiQ (UPF0313 family)